MIRIAWTFDDGPTQYTPSLIESLSQMGVGKVTWFICRHNVFRHAYFQQLSALQDQGHEIGIHEIHPVRDGVNWLPGDLSSYETIQDAMTDLTDFYNELGGYGIKVGFARLPGGELTELIACLRSKGCQNRKELYRWAMNIIDGKDVPAQYEQVKEDYAYLTRTLAKMNIRIWSGAPRGYPLLGGLPFHHNSWQAESAGVCQGRGADNITFHQAIERRKARIVEQNAGVFEKTLMKAKRDGLPGSVVVLAHDTTPGDIGEIIEDIKRMRYLSLAKGIEITYCTMSGLYNAVR